MIGTIVVNGMVLSAMPMGEYDKRLTILTVECGKISAFAKGARKPNSALLACSQPFSYGEFSLYAGRNSYTVANAQISNFFQGLRGELEKIYLGMYFCEFSEYFTRENNDEKEILKLLYQSLRALESGKFETRLVRRIFELKLICLEGEAPQVFECMRCKAKEELTCFDLAKDGALCSRCEKDLASGKIPASSFSAPNALRAYPLSAAALYALQFIAATPPAKLYQFNLKEEALLEVERVVESYIQKHVGHEMKSLKVLREMQGGR